MIECALMSKRVMEESRTSVLAAQGLSAFEEILAPVSVEQFLAETFGRRPLHLAGQAGRFSHLLDWDGLAGLLETHHLAPPRLQIVKGGKTIAAERYLRPISEGIDRIDGGALSLLFDTGATAIINHIDNLLPAVGKIADVIGDCVGARTAVNLYASWRSEQGFNAHWDYHDFFILQLAGRKQWTIYKPTRPNPLRGDPFVPPPQDAVPESIEVLEDGDVLYLPRGWIHAPVPLEPSMHLTIGIVHPTGAGFLTWLAKQLEEDPEVRASMPLLGDDASLAAWESRIAEIIRAAIEGGAPERYVQYKDAKRGARPRFDFNHFGRLPASEWNQATTFRAASLNRLILEPAEDGRTYLMAMGQAWPCSQMVATALSEITSTSSVTLDALEGGLSAADSTQLRQLLQALISFGLMSASKT
jgi:ribosomal protein L16 Arg81 hydroxylase